MTKIILQTKIKAPIGRVFNLARSINLHKASTSKTNEETLSSKTATIYFDIIF